MARLWRESYKIIDARPWDEGGQALAVTTRIKSCARRVSDRALQRPKLKGSKVKGRSSGVEFVLEVAGLADFVGFADDEVAGALTGLR